MENEPINFVFIPVVILGWIAFCVLISFIGGWSRLARKFPLTPNTGSTLNSFRWRSVNLNFLAAYGNSVNITITDLGVILKTTFLWSAFHKPIFFRWNNISEAKYIKTILGSRRFVFYLGRTRVAIFGRPAEEINSYYLTSGCRTTM